VKFPEVTSNSHVVEWKVFGPPVTRGPYIDGHPERLPIQQDRSESSLIPIRS
jgi:hypothetical protein